MANCSLTITFGWEKRDGDCSVCVGCEDIIYGNKYVLCIGIKDSVRDETNTQVCESCYDSVKEHI